MPKEKRLRICLAASEIAPFAKTGGLADVASALATRFTRLGHELRLLMPMYPSIDTSGLEVTIVPELEGMELEVGGQTVGYDIVSARSTDFEPEIHLLRCPELFHSKELYGGYDEHVRFSVLSRATIEMCQRLKFSPDVFHVHDWHTALVPVYLK